MATLKSHELKPPEYIDVIHTVQFSDDYTNPVSQPHGARWRMRRWWRRFNQIWADSWAPEIASCFIALGSLVSLIVILAVYDNEVLQDVPLGLSINTVVSILASTLKASMIMPVAECKCSRMITRISLLILIDIAISQLKWLWFGGNDRPLRDFEHFDQASRGPWGSILLVFHLRSQ